MMDAIRQKFTDGLDAFVRNYEWYRRRVQVLEAVVAHLVAEAPDSKAAKRDADRVEVETYKRLNSNDVKQPEV